MQTPILLRDRPASQCSSSKPPTIRRNLDLELQGVKTKSQVSTLCYSAKQESVADEEDNHSQSSLTQLDFEQVELPVGHQLNVLKKDFTPDHKSLGDDFDSERNRVKREAYKANHTKEQKIKVYTKWQEFMKEISSNVLFFENFENHFEWHRKSCVLTKSDWIKENKEVIRSSHPPLENITIKHQGFEIAATPFRYPKDEDKPIKKVMEQINYTNQSYQKLVSQTNTP